MRGALVLTSLLIIPYERTINKINVFYSKILNSILKGNGDQIHPLDSSFLLTQILDQIEVPYQNAIVFSQNLL